MVNYAGERLDFTCEIYLHFTGPALLFFDALILKKAFSNFYSILPFAFFINFGYFEWLEIFVQPNSDFPVGNITAGLPYPFMNDMPFEHRLIFMVMCFIIEVLFI